MIGGPIGTGIGIPPILVTTPAGLATALTQAKGPIAIEDRALAWKARVIIALGNTAIIGSIVGVVAIIVLLGAIHAGFSVDLRWTLYMKEGQLILTPPTPR